MASSTAQRRLLQEYRALTNNPPEGITAGPVSEDDLLYWEALIQGPEGTPFEGGVFPAELKFPKDYPLAPPSMRFLGEVWHPNGMFCSLLRARLFPHPSIAVLQKTGQEEDGWKALFYSVGFELTRNSIPIRSSVYLHPAPTRRRPKPLRARLGALVAHPVRGEDSDFRHEHAG